MDIRVSAELVSIRISDDTQDETIRFDIQGKFGSRVYTYLNREEAEKLLVALDLALGDN